MYNISDDYKVACKKLTRQSRTKVVIDGVTYDGSKYIKDYPKFSHSNEKMIGGFPIKSAEFSLWIKNGQIDVINKEIKIYRGLLINTEIIWIPQGVFYAQDEDVTTSDTGEYISIKCYDKAKEAGAKTYVDNNTYPISETSYIKNVITQSGYELDESVFIESNYMMTQKPNMPDNTCVREIISRYAEQRGAIALFSRLGKVQIKRPTEIDFAYKLYEYKRLTCESTFGPLNQIIIGNKNINNNIIFPSGEQTFPWTINDNPFLDLYKLDRNQEIYNQIKDLKLTPFTITSALDVFYLDINDVITIEKKDKTLQKVTILSIETENRLKCKISASVQNKNRIDYGLAGSVKKDLETVIFDVDYNKQKINALVSTTSEHQEQISQSIIDINEIKQSVSKKYDFTGESNGSNKLIVENAQAGNILKLSIKGEMELLFPEDDLYPSDDLYPLDSYLNIENNDGEIRKVRLPISYLYKVNNISDEFILEREYNEEFKKYESRCKVIRRIEVDSNGNKIIKSNEIIEELGKLDVILWKGINKIYLESFEGLSYSCEYTIINEITDGYATHEELKSFINLTESEIDISVNKKLEKYSTTEEVNANINTKANAISQSVNASLSDMDGTISELQASLELKVDTENLSSVLSGQADDINFIGNRFSWQSEGSSMSKDGHFITKDAKIGGFNIGETKFSNNISGAYDYSAFDLQICRIILLDKLNLDAVTCSIYDTNIDGSVNSTDMLNIRQHILNQNKLNRILEGKVIIDSNNSKNCLSIYDAYNNPLLQLGIGGIGAQLVTAQNIVCSEISSSTTSTSPYVVLNGVKGIIYATNNVVQSSLSERKKNIEKFEGALKIVQNIDLYKYNYKDESDQDKKHIGFVIGNEYKYSEEITSNDNKGVDMYSMTSLCMQAIKEQQEIIKKLEKKIEDLEYEIIKNN